MIVNKPVQAWSWIKLLQQTKIFDNHSNMPPFYMYIQEKYKVIDDKCKQV